MKGYQIAKTVEALELIKSDENGENCPFYSQAKEIKEKLIETVTNHDKAKAELVDKHALKNDKGEWVCVEGKTRETVKQISDVRYEDEAAFVKDWQELENSFQSGDVAHDSISLKRIYYHPKADMKVPYSDYINSSLGGKKVPYIDVRIAKDEEVLTKLKESYEVKSVESVENGMFRVEFVNYFGLTDYLLEVGIFKY